jgi:TetR/AcrR family tetracycline transcriptional repressor
LNVVRLSVVPDDRRQRARDARRQRYLDAASRITDRDGLSGVTMQALADELDCAIGTVYTYFPSKSALLTALAQQAVETLQASHRTARHGWDAALDEAKLEPALVGLVQLEAWAAFLAAAAVVYADELALARAVLGDDAGGAVDAERPALSVVRVLLEVPAGLLDEAVAAGSLSAGDTLERALRWTAALNGVLRLDALAPLDRHLFRAGHLARALTQDLLVGWGAARPDVEVASAQVERLTALGPMAPPPG